jgi:hypothetical protein
MAPLLLSDCRSSALVDEAGAVSWLCAPRFDQPAIFAGVLDPRGGALETIVEGGEPAEQGYVEGTMLVQTDIRGPDGLVRVTDCLTLGPRGPVAADEPGELVRLLTVMEGSAWVGVRIGVRYGFGMSPARWAREGRRTRAHGPGPTLELDTDLPVRPLGPDLGGGTRLDAGQVRFVSLRWQDPLGVGENVRGRVDDTAAWWRTWGERASGRREALLLRALLHGPTGALVRSATTSLAEPSADGRLCFVEDQIAAAAAFRAMGHEGEAAGIEAWLTSAGEGGPVRGLGGEEARAEMLLDHLSRPVAVGAPTGDAAGNVPFAPDLLAALAA